MPDLFLNKYRIPSARLEGFDYGSNAAYFVTICTKDREHFFGEILDSRQNSVADSIVADETPGMSSLRSPIVRLSDIEKIVETEWLKTLGLRPDMNLELGAFVVMPNHFHAIIIIGENQFYTKPELKRRRDDMPGVSSATVETAKKPSTKNEYKNQFAPQSKNLTSIIRGFKSSVTMQAKNLGYHHFGWQTRFHDYIIRDGNEFKNIQNYILNNPLTWKNDKFYTP